MHARFSIKSAAGRGWRLFGCGLVLLGCARAQETIQTGPPASSNAWLGYDWLAPAEEQQRQAASGETFSATVSQDVKDPFTVLTTGSIWQEKFDSIYTRHLADTLTLSCEGSTSLLDDNEQDLSHGQKLSFQFQPVQELTLTGNVYDSENDAPLAGESSTSLGSGLGLESHLPLNAVLTLGLNSDQTSAVVPAYDSVQTTNAYDAQLQQPLGKLPLTAVLKGHYEGTAEEGAAPTSLPSLEQSLVWKPLQDTTVQAGLRQQQYQEYPGVDHETNEALFADWSQKMMDNISWHSYAEVVNSRGLLDQAPTVPAASGTSATAQAAPTGNNASLTSSLPISVDDQTLTFSTGPSFRLEEDLSASVEYSDRWDKNPAASTAGDEQRVSISLKGTF